MKNPAHIALGFGFAGIIAAAFALSAANQPATADASPAQVGGAPASASTNYVVDTVHSSMFFKLKHMGVANFMGRFNSFNGTYTLDPENLEATTISFNVDANSVDTNSAKRDGHVKSPDFFDVANHPEMNFKSNSVTVKGESTLLVRGDLTFVGKSVPIEVTLKIIGIGQTPQGYKSGIDASFSFKRSDFGVDTYVANGGLGDQVDVMVSIEGLRK